MSKLGLDQTITVAHSSIRLKPSQHNTMKTKQLVLALALAFIGATTQFSCDSKTENKAEQVADEKEDVVEAQAEGDSDDVAEEQAELDSARRELNEAKADSARDN